MKKEIQDVLDALRTFIIEHQYEDTSMLTAYVGFDTTAQDNQRERPAWLIELKNESKLIEEQLDSEALKRLDTQNKWKNTEEMIMSHLETNKPEGRSTVIFTDHQDFLTLNLPIPLQTKLYYGAPQLKPLLFSLDHYKKFAVVLFSEEEAKIHEVFLTVPSEEARVQTGPLGGISLRPGGQTARTQASKRRDLETERQVVKVAAEEINKYLQSDFKIEHFVFGGNLKIAHAVKNALHPSINASLITIQPMSFDSTNNEIAKNVKDIAESRETEHDLALVDELVSRRHACGTAVLEPQGVRLALEQGQVSKVVFSVPFECENFDKLVIKCILNNCDIEFLHGKAAAKLNEFGGVAAVLYYSGK